MSFSSKSIALSMSAAILLTASGCKKTATIPANSKATFVAEGTPVINTDGTTTPAPAGGENVLVYPDGTIHAMPAGLQMTPNNTVATDTTVPATSTPAPAATTAPAPAPVSKAAAAPATAVAPKPAPAPAPVALVVPSGTRITIRITQSLSSKTSEVGEGFSGVISSPVTVNDATAFKAGTPVQGAVTASKGQGRFKGEGGIAISLTSIGGIPVQTTEYVSEVKGKGKRTAGFIGGGTGAGALIGGLAGGGKGALIGALAGAGAGTAGAAYTGNQAAVIPSESIITFRLQGSVTVK